MHVKVLPLAFLSHISSLWRSSKNVYNIETIPKSCPPTSSLVKDGAATVCLCELRALPHAKTLYRKFETNTPRKGTARLQPQFLHSCFCDRFIYTAIGVPILLWKICVPIVGIYGSLTDTCMWKLGLRPLSSFSGNKYINRNFFVVCKDPERGLVTGDLSQADAGGFRSTG